MTKKNATTSKSADGKTWVMPEAKPKAAKKGKKAKAASTRAKDGAMSTSSAPATSMVMPCGLEEPAACG